MVASWAGSTTSPSPIRARIARRSRRLKLRPRIAASPSAARVPAGSRAARRSMSVRTADGTSRAALRPSRHSPSTCWSVPASRCVRASSSTMNGTPSDWTCIAAAEVASTGPPRTRFSSSPVSTELNRPGRSRRTRPIRSMSATKFTASVTDANSSGRIVRNRKIGRSASLRTTYRSSRSVSSSAHWTSSMSSASGRSAASVETATPARSKARRSLASGDRLSNPGSSRPEMASTTRSDRGLGRRPRGRVADRARGEQAPRDEERPADLLVGGDRDTREPARRGELGGGEQEARLADARLALEGHRREAAGRLAQLLRDRIELGASPDDRAGRPAQLDRERALRPDEGVERAAVGHPEGRAMLNGCHVAQHAAEYDVRSSDRDPATNAAARTPRRYRCGSVRFERGADSDTVNRRAHAPVALGRQRARPN